MATSPQQQQQSFPAYWWIAVGACVGVVLALLIAIATQPGRASFYAAVGVAIGAGMGTAIYGAIVEKQKDTD